MMQLRRSRRNKSKPLLVSSRISTRNKRMKIGSQGYEEKLTSKEKSVALLSGCFQNMCPRVWYRILPEEDENDHICSGFGQEWSNVLPLLVDSGLLKHRFVDGCDYYDVARYEWEAFCLKFLAENSTKLHFTSYRKFKHVEIWFVSLNTPNYRSPKLQIDAITSKQFAFNSLRYYDRNDTSLKNDIVNQSMCLLNNFLSTNVNEVETVADAEEVNEPTETPTVLSKIEGEINFALTLDLTRRPRMIRSGVGEVELHQRAQATDLERTMVLFTAKRWGWMDPMITQKMKQRIAKAACMQIAYDYGFLKPLAMTQLPRWNLLLNQSIEQGVLKRDNPLSPLHSGSNKYIDAIEKQHPGYVRSLFRYAQRVKGAKATYSELAHQMNEKSAIEGEQRTTLFLSRKQVADWFKSQGGKEYSPKEKPLDTPEHKRLRKIWVRDWWDILTDEKAPVAYIDEKWFYTTNRRQKLKKLPLGEDEEKDADSFVQPKMFPSIPRKVHAHGCCCTPTA